MRKNKMLVLAGSLALLGGHAEAATVSAFTSVSGLDFQGQFTYAVSANTNAAGLAIGNATFSSMFNTAGFAVSYQYYIGGWRSQNYGASVENTRLNTVMNSIVWSGGSTTATVVNLTFSNLVVGQTYKTQLLFGEGCCDRGYDVYRGASQIANDVSPYGLNGNTLGSAVVTDSFVATATSVSYGLGYYGGHPDSNPILNAATLELVTVPPPLPEPASLLLLLSGLGLAGTMGRRSIRQLH